MEVDIAMPLWSRQNMDQQGLVSQSQYKDILNRSQSMLTETVTTTGLWAHLRSLEVLNHSKEEEIRYNAPTSETIRRLLAHIHQGPTWRFHALLRALVLTSQDHVITQILKMDPNDYKEEW